VDKADNDERARAHGDGGAAALGIALDAARADPAITEDARILLREQARLARMQADQIDEEAALARWTSRVRHANEVMKVAFQLSVALVVLAIVAALASAMWSAARDNGLVIEAFSVPPDFATRGLNGEVVASQLLDKLTHMQEETNSIRPADTYRNNWGDDIKVEIPDTGISISELNRYLRHWLGHETHITGEIYRVPDGIAVTARARDAGTTFTGKEADLDKLLQKAAEAIYGETQPYRYAAFLSEMGRYPEAFIVAKKLTAVASPAERAWADSLLGNFYQFYNMPGNAIATLRAGVAADPSNAHAWDNLANAEQSLDHVEEGYRYTRQAVLLYDKDAAAFDPDRVAIIKLQDKSFLTATVGDFLAAAATDETIRQLPDRNASQQQAAIDEALQVVMDHDVPRARMLLAQVHAASPNTRINLWFQSAAVAYFAHDWNTLSHLLDRGAAFRIAPVSFRHALEALYTRIPDSLLAEAKAEQGDIAGARRLIAITPVDCYDCARVRGRIDMIARNWDGAAYWFAIATREGPSIPMAFNDWGTMLLRKGHYDGAMVEFAEASARGPHYADPLEGWGEALMQANRSDLALAKFSAAAGFAPNWARLHLEWGKALYYLGRKSEARAQWKQAAQLYLSADDRAQLSRLLAL
jgi:tetratricopeptide (TPR) repeat protein